MPYRAELKRPDLKGSFPCSVCGKIFCHSSSLSRHRMQAHFKSYTCTQCNAEISSNETLRSHMFRAHAISRMFMCRCCNWAFPDKTSLHIHMQSMLRNGHPGEVAVLARSSTEEGAINGMEASSSRSPSQESSVLKLNNNNLSLPSNNPHLMQSIFPQLNKPENILNQIRDNQISSSNLDRSLPNPWLTAWLNNNKLAQQFAFDRLQQSVLLEQQHQQPSSSSGVITANEQHEIDAEEMSDDDQAIEINNEDDTNEEADLSGGESPKSSSCADSMICNSAASLKRKASTSPRSCDREEESKEADENPTAPKILCDEKDSSDQPSPAVSDSHTSGSSIHMEQQTKCFDCQIAKIKLLQSEERVQVLESRVLELQAGMVQLNREIALKSTIPVMRPIMERIQPIMPVPFLNSEAVNMKMFLDNFMQYQAAINRPNC